MAKEAVAPSPCPRTAVCGDGGFPHSFPARADFVWIGHTVVPAVDPLVLIICAGFPSPLLTSASIMVKLGLGQEEKGGRLVKVAFPFVFSGSLVYGTWSLPSYTCVFLLSWWEPYSQGFFPFVVNSGGFLSLKAFIHISRPQCLCL